MSHQRFPSIDPVKEPHSISLKVLRLSRPSLVPQHPVQPPTLPSSADAPPRAAPASLAYGPSDTNPEPFLLSPALHLPISFGSAYVGESFSCTLCVNHDIPEAPPGGPTKRIRDVRLEAEMKTPGPSGAVTRLELEPADVDKENEEEGKKKPSGIDLESGRTLQKVVRFDLKEEGNHVLAVTVSYYEATEVSGRTRTFRKLYQFICKTSLIVRTKTGELSPLQGRARWVLEAQLENCSEDVMQLERVGLELADLDGLDYSDCNWGTSGRPRPVLQPGDVEQVMFIVKEKAGQEAKEEVDGRTVFGVLSIGWRGEMGSRGSLTTGQLGSKARTR